MNKFIKLSTTILLVGIMLFACKEHKIEENKTAFHSNPQGKIKLRWLAQWYGEGKKETLIREIARDYSFINQDIDVVIEFPYQMVKIDSNLPTFAKTRDSIRKMILANSWPYDLMLCDAYIYRQAGEGLENKNWGEKYLVDFKNEKWFVDSHKNILNSSNIAETYGGIAPGAFIEGIWDVLYVSSTVEDKLGIKVKDYDMTIDDLMEYAKATYTYNQSHNDKITFFSMQWYGGTQYLFNQLVISEIGKENPNSIDPFPILLKVYQKFEFLSQYKPVEAYSQFKGERELQHDKILFNFCYTWVTLFWQANNPEGEKKMRPCELPSMPGKIARSYPGKYNAVFVVPKNSKNKDAAIRLMKFISSSDIAYKWEKYSKCPTGLKSNVAFNQFGTNAFSRLSQHMDTKYNSTLEEVNLSQMLFNTNKNIDFMPTQVLQGSLSATQAIEQIKAQLKK